MSKKGLTYAQAGVDIDAGNRMVELIKPLVQATARPGADAEIGGFGGLFDLKRAGFKDPVLVAANDGVGTKVKIAIETGLHDTIGIDLVAMSVNDLVVQGAEPLFFLDYFATGKLDPEVGAEVVKGIAEGCRQAGCALIGGETAEMPGVYHGDDYDLAGFAVGAAERGAILPRARHRAPATSCSASPRRACTPTAIRWCARSSPRRSLAWSAPAPFDQKQKLGEALLDADPHLREILPRRDPRDQARSRRSPTSPAAAFPTTSRACCRRTSARASTSRASRCCRCSNGWPQTGGIAEQEMLRTFNCGIGMIAVVDARARPTRSPPCSTREGETRRAARRGRRRGEGRAARDLYRPPRSAG